MKKLIAALAVLPLAVLLTVGCGKAPVEGPELSAPVVMQTVYESATLCGKCGEVKGGEACCVADAEICADCKLHKGAPGCCKIEAGADATLCAHCGEVKGSESCCVEGAATCEKCGLHKGAPGCCTLKKVVAEEEAPAATEES